MIAMSMMVFTNMAALTFRKTPDCADVLIFSAAGNVARIDHVLVSQIAVADFVFIA